MCRQRRERLGVDAGITSDIMVVEKREMHLDTHMLAAHKLIQKQFPNLDGCQSTLLCQNRGFSAVYGIGI